jgi:ADP-ribose pyrophosphatase YjhB (NUDIX family)
VEAEGLIAHDVLAVVLRIDGRDTQHRGEHADRGAGPIDTVPSVLLWQRAREPDAGRWALPGGRLGAGEDVEASVRRHLAEKVDLAEVAHVEQLSVFSDPHRGPAPRRVATAFLGLVPSDADPAIPDDTAWHPVDALPRIAFDHGEITRVGLDRLRAKLSYTNIGFALAPDVFSISELRRLYAAALGHHVSATNLQRVLTRRGVLVPTGTTAAPGPAGGRPAALFRFSEHSLRVTDPFAALRPPSGAGAV